MKVSSNFFLKIFGKIRERKFLKKLEKPKVKQTYKTNTGNYLYKYREIFQKLVLYMYIYVHIYVHIYVIINVIIKGQLSYLTSLLDHVPDPTRTPCGTYTRTYIRTYYLILKGNPTHLPHPTLPTAITPHSPTRTYKYRYMDRNPQVRRIYVTP